MSRRSHWPLTTIGRPDILVVATYSDADAIRPFVCRNVSSLPTGPEQTGIAVPTFQVPPVEKADAYFAVGPIGDYDGDGMCQA
jgi:hypothetical protein